jgi:hypothetical protein
LNKLLIRSKAEGGGGNTVGLVNNIRVGLLQPVKTNFKDTYHII